MEIVNSLATEDKHFIHFSTSKLCQEFKVWYRGNIGHTCCYGKGCHLKSVKSFSEAYALQREFLSTKETIE